MPSDSEYDETRKVFNAMIDKRPGMFVMCKDVADVITYSAGGAYSNFMMDEGQQRVKSIYKHNYMTPIKKQYDPIISLE